jgi:cytochrome c oxidase subunit IV
MDHSAAKHGSHGKEEHHGSMATYLTVFATLVVLTIISFAVGNSHSLRVNAPGVMWAAMMAISTAKAMLVILFFMHMKWEANWKYVLTIPASIMCVFLVLMLIPDIGRRTKYYSEDRWLHSTPKAPVHSIEANPVGHAEGAGH